MSEEQNRFSLRKLSVGLASVLIGVSIFGTSQTVKADTVADQNTSAVTSNAQSSDTQENKNAVKSSFSSDNQANNVKSNLIQTQVEGKKDRKQDSVPKTQEATDSSNLDAEKDIVSTSSLQEPDNQSNNHAEDNSQTQNEQKLDLTKNIKKFAKKVLATNLAENQAINDSTDPSQIDPSHFADGTHWTTAGWTRTDKNTKVAKKSSLVISDWKDGHNESTPWRQPVTNNTSYYLQDLNFTIDKNDIKKGNKILIATVQNLPTNTKQAIDGSQLFMYTWFLTDKYNINYQNKTIGNITASQLDKDEIDLYYNSTTTLNNLNNLASDPTFNIHLGRAISIDNMDRKDYAKYHTNFPYNYCIVTNHNIREYDTYIANATNALPKNTVDQWYNWSRYNDGFAGWSGLAITNSEHQLTGDKNINDADYIVKIQSINNSNLDPRSIRINTTTYFSVIDANGNPTDEITEMYDSDDKNGLKQAQDNLSSIDLWNATPTGYSYYSKQHDGSILLCIKQRPNIDSINQINQNSLRNWADGSYLANVQDPDHKQQIINNTVNKTKGWVAYTSNFRLGSYGIYQITDVTPSNYSKHTNLGTTTVEFLDPNSNIPSGSADLETYKNVKISYIDDDATDSTKSDISSDTMTGRQNKASTYTVNIPKGYYLDDNNTSTGYTWNADHTDISYTFNKDQAKNDANPIEIHLKHKHTAVTDSSQLQTTGKRTITITLPHQDKPMIIIQTVGYKRTGTYDEVIEASKGLDEAEKEGNYTDWMLDADTSNVTVDGQLSTQYQAYVLKDGVVNYAPIKLPHINGYKVKLIQDKANPAMFMVSFVAVPTETKPSNPVEVAPSKPSANADNTNKPADDLKDLKQRVVTELNSNDSGWTMPNTQPATYTAEVPADNTINLSDLVIAEPVHAQTTTQIRVTKRFKLSKKHSIKHLKHRKKAVRTFRKYRL